jgi:hypothetical protein
LFENVPKIKYFLAYVNRSIGPTIKIILLFQDNFSQTFATVRRTFGMTGQAVGMSQACFCNRRVAGQMEVHYSVIDRLMQPLQVTVMIDERPRSGRPRKTKHREDRQIALCGWKNRFPTSARIRGELNFGGHISVKDC